MKLDREEAVRLYNLINDGPSVGVNTDGDIVSDNTALGTALYVLGFPNQIHQWPLPNNQTRTVTLPNGQKYTTNRDWDTKQAAGFLRQWADALEGKDAHI